MKKALPILIILILGLIIWFPIFNIFYLQDEWQGLGHIIAEGITHPFAGANIVELMFGENRSLARFFGYILFGKFQLNSFPLSIFSLTFHFVNTYLVFKLSRRLIKDRIFQLLASVIFMLSSVSSNAVYWYSASVGTLPATTLILLSVLVFFRYLQKGNSKDRYLVFFLIFVSLFFKEIGIFLFLLLPVYEFFFYRRQESVFTFTKKYWLFLVFFLAIVFFRVSVLKEVSGEKALFLTGTSENFVQTLFVRAIYYPLTSFSLQYFPAPFILDLSKVVTSNYYPFIAQNQFDLVNQTLVLDGISLVLSLIILFSLISLSTKEKVESKKIIFFWVMFTILSFLPYIIISKTYSYLESRYFYLSMSTASILLSWLIFKLVSSRNFVLKTLSALILISYLFGHVKYLRRELVNQALISIERKNLITQINSLVEESLEQKNVFYITSDTDYYVIGNKLPFQQGVGYTLMIILKNKIPISNKFLLDHYLWDIGTQGYKEIDGYGFGYFYDEKDLIKAIRENRIEKKWIHTFFYDSKTKKLRDVTPDILDDIYQKR